MFWLWPLGAGAPPFKVSACSAFALLDSVLASFSDFSAGCQGWRVLHSPLVCFICDSPWAHGHRVTLDPSRTGKDEVLIKCTD